MKTHTCIFFTAPISRVSMPHVTPASIQQSRSPFVTNPGSAVSHALSSRVARLQRTIRLRCCREQQSAVQQQQVSSFAAGSLSRRSAARQALMVAAAGLALQLASPHQASALTCPGLRGYELQQCLKRERKKREAEGGGEEEEEAARLKYNQPGELVTLPSGLQYREITVGTGEPAAAVGSECEIMYTVYRLSSGGYYKYSGGGTPVYMWSVGFGNEGRDDVGEVYRFRLGDPDALPRPVTVALVGMRAGGRRRVLIPPGGWVSEQTGPRPPSFGAQRRWATHKDEALLFEAQLVRVRPPSSDDVSAAMAAQDASLLTTQPGAPFRLPAPPSPYKQQLPENQQ